MHIINFYFTRTLFFIFSIILLTIFSCRRPVAHEREQNRLHLSMAGEVSTLDPATSYDTISAAVIYQCYETLYQYHYLKRPYSIVPLLAQDMPVIENNGTRYIIKIKKNVVYHNDPSIAGTQRVVKASDFITQFKRLAFHPTKSQGNWMFENSIKGVAKFTEIVGDDFSKFESTPIEGLSAPDDYTLIIDLVAPYPQMLSALAMSFSAPIPIESFYYYKNDLREHVVGTGPFQLANWTPSTGLRLERFEKYRDDYYPSQGDRVANTSGLLDDAGKKIPFVEGIDFSIMKEGKTRWLSFLKGKIDFAVLPGDNFSNAITPNRDLTDELKNRNVQLQISPSLTYWWIEFNMKDPILGKNKLLRKAIAHAIDIEDFIKIYTNYVGLKANSIYPPGVPGYDPARVLPFEYDLKKAKEFLSAAGFPNGKGLPTLHFDLRADNLTAREQGNFIAKNLKHLGINVEVVPNTFPKFLQKAKEGSMQLWQGGWQMDYPDAENCLQLLVSEKIPPGPNSSYYSNPKFDSLFEKLKIMNDGEEKYKLMRQMENIVQEDLPRIMLFYGRDYILLHGHLKNFRHSDMIANYVKYIKIDPH